MADLSISDWTTGDILNAENLNSRQAEIEANVNDLDLAQLESGSDGQIIVCNASGVPVYKAMSGDASIDNAGALALASNSVDTNEIADDAVATAKIPDGAVTAAKLSSSVQAMVGAGTDQRDYAEVLDEETRTSTNLGDLSTVGPSITLEVPSGALVALFATAEMKASSGDAAMVAIHEPTDRPATSSVAVSTNEVVLALENTSYFPRYTRPRAYTTTDANDIGTIIDFAGALIFPASEGTLTYTLKYAVQTFTTGTAWFKNRKLWGWVIGGFS